MDKNFKRGLIDGYFKIFDVFGMQRIGTDKYNDFDIENYKSYYAAMSLMMFIMVFTILISLVSAIISIVYGNLIIAYVLLSIYFLTTCPLYYTMIIGVVDYIQNYWVSKK